MNEVREELYLPSVASLLHTDLVGLLFRLVLGLVSMFVSTVAHLLKVVLKGTVL